MIEDKKPKPKSEPDAQVGKQNETQFPDSKASPDADPPATWGVTIELVKRYKNGDQASLNQIFDRYYERVFRILRIHFQGSAWMGPRIDVDDIVQDTFKKAFEIFDRFEMEEPASLVNWLVKIARNRIRDERDRNRAQVRDMRREVSLTQERDDSRSIFDFADSVTLPADVLQRAEELQIVDDCVAELSGDWKTVILLKDYEGGSWAHVADQMGRSVGAVEMLHRRARLKLAQGVGARLRPDEG